MTPKTYPALKMFILAAYGCRLMAMALCSTSGQNGYAHQRIYNIMEAGLDDDTNDDTATTITQTAALSTATGGRTPSSGTAIGAEVAAAINQLLANQTALMSQIAATTAQTATLSIVPPTAQHTRAFVLPIQHVAAPMQQLFAPAGMYHPGRRGWRGGHGRDHGGCRGSCSRTPFVDAMCGAGAAPAMPTLIPYGGGLAQLPAAPGVQQQHRNPDFSNIYKVTTIGVCASNVDLTLKMGTRPSHAPSKVESPGFVHARECPAVHSRGIQSMHEGYAQDGLTLKEEHVMMGGGELWFSKYM